MTENLSHFFKPEVRSAADDLLSSKAVYLKIGSDTQIDASVRGTTPVQVAFRSPSIEATSFTADCSCKPSAKGQMCKHIWATLVLASEKQPDFFVMKTSIDKGELFAEKAAAKVAAISPEAAQRKVDYEQRQADARKKSYQAQKERAKEMKAKRDGVAVKPSKLSPTSKSQQFVPAEVQDALKYFEANGFPLSFPLDDEALNNAKRVLARVFHPDKGGTQEEVLELLRNADVLLKHR